VLDAGPPRAFLLKKSDYFFIGEEPGYLIVGIMGALSIISVLTGLILW
jgi:uncharacterized iron-regulated membrane protein